MSAGVVMLEFGAAEAALASLRSSRVGIAAELQKLEDAAQGLSGSWSGDAERAYRSAQAQWSTSMVELNAVLDAACTVLQIWIEGMRQTERDLAQGWPG